MDKELLASAITKIMAEDWNETPLEVIRTYSFGLTDDELAALEELFA